MVSREELDLERRALRQNWEIPAERKARLLNRLLEILDPPAEGAAKVPYRTQIAAAKTLAIFCRLSLEQAKSDASQRPETDSHPDVRDVLLSDASRMVSEGEKGADRPVISESEEDRIARLREIQRKLLGPDPAPPPKSDRRLFDGPPDEEG